MPALENKLLVVAHPDDETIFFGGWLQRTRGVRVVCVTNGDADRRGAERRREFRRACAALGAASCEQWDQPDDFDRRLDVDAIAQRLQTLGRFSAVFTHSVIGDYGHRHHQDVALAVARAFPRARREHVAYNCRPDRVVALKPAEFALKLRVLTDVYGKETRRFLNVLPCTSSEGFARVGVPEIEAIYEYLAGVSPLPSARRLPYYGGLRSYLEILKIQQARRLF